MIGDRYLFGRIDAKIKDLMLIRFFAVSLIVLLSLTIATAQVPVNIGVQILKAEDARRYDTALENLMRSPDAEIRKRAALAAGRIGKEEAIGPLVVLLEKDADLSVRTMAAFALGEIESIKAADALLARINSRISELESPPAGEILPMTKGPWGSALTVLARSIEAAGKIAAANPKDEKSKQLGSAVLKLLDMELKTRYPPDVETIFLGLTAVLRARPAGADEIVRKFLAYTDPNIVANALNTLARLRAKNANRDARDLLTSHVHAIVRANAARVLGAAEDKDAVDVLIKAATSDSDSRVRVSAIRSLGLLRDARVSDQLIAYGKALMKRSQASKVRPAPERNELLELATALGRLIPRTNDVHAAAVLQYARDSGWDSQADIAYIQVAPKSYVRYVIDGLRPKIERSSSINWLELSNAAQAFRELASVEPDKGELVDLKREASDFVRSVALASSDAKESRLSKKAMPDIMRSYAAFKPDDLEATLRENLASSDVFIRATAAELLAENAPSTTVRLAIENAFKKALTTDKHDNDAQLALLDAMAKVNKAAALDTIYLALDAPDYLVRKKAFKLLDDPELNNKFPGVVNVVRDAKARHKDEVQPYDPKSGTKLGQVLNTDADYRRAFSRKNGSVKAVVTTQKGTFIIDLLPEDAPLTVDNFVKLARSNYFNGLEVHRVVPNFVMQDGDPRGDGNGGPGWSIRCEINMVPYERGAVGMALSGKDTGGSQWFVTHSPQPHLDGGYTVFGKVNDAGMKVVDNIVRGDKITSIKIVEGKLLRRNR